MRKALIGILLVAAVATLVLVIVLPRRPEPAVLPPGNPWTELFGLVRLVPRRGVLAERDLNAGNAFYHIRELGRQRGSDKAEAALLEEYEQFCVTGYQRGRFPGLEGRFSRNIELVRTAYAAAELSKAQVVTIHDRQVPQHYLAGVRTVTQILHFEAEREAYRGRWDAVLKAYRTILVVGDHLTRGGLFSDYFTHISSTATACESIRRVCSIHDVPPDVLAELSALVVDLEANTEPVAETLRYEYLATKSELDRVFTSGLPPASSTFHEVQFFVDAIFTQLIYFAEAPFYPRPHERTMDSLLADIAGPSGMNSDQFRDTMKETLSLLTPPLANVQEEFLLHAVNLRGTAVALALRAYQLAEGDGALPGNLMALCPHHLPRVPKDPFSRGSEFFRYRAGDTAGNWWVYSVGPDQIDGGGANPAFRFGYRPGAAVMPDITFSSAEFAPVDTAAQ